MAFKGITLALTSSFIVGCGSGQNSGIDSNLSSLDFNVTNFDRNISLKIKKVSFDLKENTYKILKNTDIEKYFNNGKDGGEFSFSIECDKGILTEEILNGYKVFAEEVEKTKEEVFCKVFGENEFYQAENQLDINFTIYKNHKEKELYYDENGKLWIMVGGTPYLLSEDGIGYFLNKMPAVSGDFTLGKKSDIEGGKFIPYYVGMEKNDTILDMVEMKYVVYVNDIYHYKALPLVSDYRCGEDENCTESTTRLPFNDFIKRNPNSLIADKYSNKNIKPYNITFSEISNIVNELTSNYIYITDMDSKGEEDYFSFLENGAGDCEDFVLTLIERLLKLGVRREKFRMVSGDLSWNYGGGGHAWLEFTLDNGEKLLIDNSGLYKVSEFSKEIYINIGIETLKFKAREYMPINKVPLWYDYIKDVK